MKLVAALALALGLLCLMVYWASLKARRRLAGVYETLGTRWRGQVVKGSFFRPPALHYDVDGRGAELSAFYLRRGTFSNRFARLMASFRAPSKDAPPVLPPHGSRPGHYTQLRFHLERRVFESFVITPDGEAPSGYRIESIRPELPTHLLENGWASKLDDIEAICNRGRVLLRFDGDTLTIRKAALLMALPNVEAFAVAGGHLLKELVETLAERDDEH